MATKIKALSVQWRPILLGRDDEPRPAASALAMEAVSRAVRRWARTPYMAGQATPQAGVDCVRFVCCVLDDLEGQKVEIERLPQDMALHDRESAIAALRTIMRLYPTFEQVDDGYAEPGDVVIVGHVAGGPGHALIVGPRRNTMWHAAPSGVDTVGWALEADWQALKTVFRCTNKARWVDGR